MEGSSGAFGRPEVFFCRFRSISASCFCSTGLRFRREAEEVKSVYDTHLSSLTEAPAELPGKSTTQCMP